MTKQESAPLVDEFTFVGVGASAGGLEAFTEFLSGLPDQHDMVIVLVQHLDPNHESLMPELVSKKTGSPVHSVTDNMKVERGHIYLMPPGYEMEVAGGNLILKELKKPRGLRRPIDRFFRSMAQEYRERAVAVVLSGTGSDGAEGAREVRGGGGLVFVQDPSEAKYDGMPQSVLDLGGADIVSAAREIVDVVSDYFQLRSHGQTEFASDDEFLSRVMRHVRFRTGYDFSEYKPATMLRRIAVRMSVLNIHSAGAYLRYIAEHKKEGEQLFRDLLINVTSFFRDREYFSALEKQVIPELVQSCEGKGEIRVWVAGCSTGEEAYSIGMLLAEEIDRSNSKCKITIFGTDIDEDALAKARLGQYSDAIVENVPAELLDHYFRPRSGGYEVGPRLREIVRFSQHSFIKDSPFSKLNLVSCRNVLIYFRESLQETAIRVFHYALNEGGYLFIGPSENPKPLMDCFNEVSGRARIFQRKPGAAQPLHLGVSGASSFGLGDRPLRKPANDDLPNELEAALLKRYAPAHLHIDQSGDVIFASENAAKYLRIRAGKLSNAAVTLIAPELESSLRRVLRVGGTTGATQEQDFQGTVNDTEMRIVLVAERLPNGSILLVLNDRLDLRTDRPSSQDTDEHMDSYVQELEKELDEANQTVRTTVEELETSNEELKSSNEEMMSMNEELQAANEELNTINDELQAKLRELHQANVDLRNFTESSRVATVFLDGQLRLKNFTPEAQEYFSFTKSDIGRRIADLNSSIDHSRLIELCETVLEDQKELSHEFSVDQENIDLAVDLLPYSPDGKDQKGVVFTLRDVTELRMAIEEAEEQKLIAQERLNEVEQIYRTSPIAMGLIDSDMRFIRLNEKLAEINGEPIERHIGARIRDIIPAVADDAEAMISKVISTGQPINDRRVTGSAKARPDDVRVWKTDWVPHMVDKEITAVSVNVRDITEEVETAESLRRVMRELEHRVKNMLANVTALINQARREVKGDNDIYEKLIRRIDGLSKTHALLTSEKWASASLRDIILPETETIYGEQSVTISGPEVRVNSQTTLALGMAIHEMATNAAKYGAFSRDGGHVSITWFRINDAEGDRLRIEWRETGGPEVRKPEKTGFGTHLISSTLAGTLDGNVSIEWEPEGLGYVIELDYLEVTATNDQQALLQ